MENPIEERKRMVQSRIEKSFNEGLNVPEMEELEKAHQDGDHHPTKPWVWVSSANGGKGDWRVEGGRTHRKQGEIRTAANKINPKETSKSETKSGEKKSNDNITMSASEFAEKVENSNIDWSCIRDIIDGNVDSVDDLDEEYNLTDEEKKLMRVIQDADFNWVDTSDYVNHSDVEDYMLKRTRKGYIVIDISEPSDALLIEAKKSKVDKALSGISNN